MSFVVPGDYYRLSYYNCKNLNVSERPTVRYHLKNSLQTPQMFNWNLITPYLLKLRTFIHVTYHILIRSNDTYLELFLFVSKMLKELSTYFIYFDDDLMMQLYCWLTVSFTRAKYSAKWKFLKKLTLPGKN